MTLPNMALLAATAGGATFNPITDVGWAHAYWTEGSEFTALGYSDGGNVTSWPDEVGTADLASISTAPTLTASWSAGNSQPAIAGSESENRGLRGAYGSTLSNPLTVVVVGGLGTTGVGFRTLFDNDAGGAASVYRNSGTGTMALAAGSAIIGGAIDNNAHLWVAYLNGASSVHERDGSTLASGNTGTTSMTGITLMISRASSSATWDNGPIAFVGVYSGGDARSDSGWADFESWVSTHYGITIA